MDNVERGDRSALGSRNRGKEISEPDLVEALKRGETFAFHYAVRQYSNAMLVTARALVDVDTAEDVVQESWSAVVEAIEGFEGRSKLKTWLCRITANRARNRLRRQGRELNMEFNETMEGVLGERFEAGGAWGAPMQPWRSDTALALMESEALQDCLDRHIGALPNLQRAALTLTDLRQLSSVEVGAILDISGNSLRVALHRARQRLLLMLEHYQATGDC